LFDDVDDIATKCKDDDELYHAIDNVFKDNAVKQSQMKNRIKFLKSTNWKQISEKTFDVYKNSIK
jgi:hypothetical protein